MIPKEIIVKVLVGAVVVAYGIACGIESTRINNNKKEKNMQDRYSKSNPKGYTKRKRRRFKDDKKDTL